MAKPRVSQMRGKGTRSGSESQRQRNDRAQKDSRQVTDQHVKAWAFMAAMGVSLSDDPVIRETKEYRQLVDKARKALFDLYASLESSVRPGRRSAMRHTVAEVQQAVSNLMRLWTGVGRHKKGIAILAIAKSRQSLRRLVRQSLARKSSFISGSTPGVVAVLDTEDLLRVIRNARAG